jgi:hypothetical protein
VIVTLTVSPRGPLPGRTSLIDGEAEARGVTAITIRRTKSRQIKREDRFMLVNLHQLFVRKFGAVI